MNKLYKNIIFKKLYYAVEHTIVHEKPQINFLSLKKKKKEFIIENKGFCLEVNQLSKHINKEQHVFLIVNNEQVITKTIKEKLDAQKAVQTAFPNLDINDFYYESYASNENTFVSICRKIYIDELIQEYKKMDIHIIDYSLGNIISTQILPYINETELETANAILSIKDKAVTNIIKTEKELNSNYIINDLSVSNTYINSLAGILSYYTHQTSTQKSFINIVKELQNKFTQKRTFNLGIKFGLSFIFVLLLLNFLIFSSYRDKINILNSEIEVGEGYKGNLLKLKNEVEKKKKIIDEITSSETSRVSLFLDKIGTSIPSTVLLSQINYQPLIKKIKEEKEIQYQTHKIIVKGKSNKADDFSTWITKLEQYKWIKSISVINYGTGKKSITEFELKIILSK